MACSASKQVPRSRNRFKRDRRRGVHQVGALERGVRAIVVVAGQVVDPVHGTFDQGGHDALPPLPLPLRTHIASAGALHVPVATLHAPKPTMDTNVSRVLRLFRLSVPPVFFLLACYVCLGEHVFGLAYVVGKRLTPRLRATLRGLYRLSSAFIALVMHAYLWYACADDDEEGAPLCPRTRFKERHCLAITSASALYCGATLLVERWANPLLEPRPADGSCARARAPQWGSCSRGSPSPTSSCARTCCCCSSRRAARSCTFQGWRRSTPCCPQALHGAAHEPRPHAPVRRHPQAGGRHRGGHGRVVIVLTHFFKRETHTRACHRLPITSPPRRRRAARRSSCPRRSWSSSSCPRPWRWPTCRAGSTWSPAAAPCAGRPTVRSAPPAAPAP